MKMPGMKERYSTKRYPARINDVVIVAFNRNNAYILQNCERQNQKLGDYILPFTSPLDIFF